MNQEIKICQNCKQYFAVEPEDFLFYEKVGVSAPTWCADCRRMRRMASRNDYHFYYRECGLCKRNIISIYSPDKVVPIYCNKCWWGDSWDPTMYRKVIDFSRPFFLQFRELLDKVPALAILNDNTIASDGCEYTNYFALGKDCYFTMNSWKVENCMYCYHMVDAKDMVDVMTVFKNSNTIYDSIFVGDCSFSRNIYHSSSLLHCAFCYDCRGCDYCFLSFGLRNKKYYFKNQPYSEEEYSRIIESYRLHTWSGTQKARKEFEKFILHFPRRPAQLTNCVNCTGNYLVNSKNALYCFNAIRVEDSKYFENGDTIKDSYDCHSGGEQELCYEGINPDNSYGTCFTSYCHKDRNVFYSDSCQTSEDLFGCVGLKNAKYCILNTQYERDEYFRLRLKLVEYMKSTGEWGEFFPIGLSRFAYNETLAQQDYALTKEVALQKGYTWQDQLQFTSGKETLSWDAIPDSIHDVPELIAQSVLSCVLCARNFKIVDAELRFYRANAIPIPRHCFYCRLGQRLRMRNPVRLWRRRCGCGRTKDFKLKTENEYSNTAKHFHGERECLNEFETSYAPERSELVYCEECYQAEVA